MLLQEVTPEILSSIEVALPKYSRIDSNDHPGWFRECNILWNKSLFNLLGSGVADLEISNSPYSGLSMFLCI
jgi:hypothetical protein